MTFFEPQDTATHVTLNNNERQMDIPQMDEEEKKARQDMPPPTKTKRPLSTTTSSSSFPELINTGNINAGNKDTEKSIKIVIKKNKKKAKKNPHEETLFSISDIEKKLLPAKDNIISNAQKYPLNYENFARLIFETQGKSNISDIAK
ncbi:hypothetical protein WN55_00317 [Dufourea novaeangliae]|uniref:Uncharacterized protein n=1 Tax=Dufourea novaeangliae TaxID=178035 RepID=A0A154PAF7_DUFNO|nr:hypothetical protein WN55_00317 [Dufourea novaeangliae]